MHNIKPLSLPSIQQALVEALREKLERAERERDDYQSECHTLNERLKGMTSAASSAAASTVTAIERIQEMEKVVLAAETWAQGGPHAALNEAVREWQRFRRSWS